MATPKRNRRTSQYASAGGSLGALLISAHEEERKRVARELHDGISQELAVISIQVAQARMSAKDEATRSSLGKVYDKLQQVLSDVGRMSAASFNSEAPGTVGGDQGALRRDLARQWHQHRIY